MTQGILGFQYEVASSPTGLTALGGLPLWMDIIRACGLADALDEHVGARQHSTGWTDSQLLMSGILLQVAGGDCVDDLERLEQDEGFSKILWDVEHRNLPRRQRRELARRWKKQPQRRSVPSPSAMRTYLRVFESPDSQEVRSKFEEETGKKAFIPQANRYLQGLAKANAQILRQAQKWSPEEVATLDQDATLAQTYKRDALLGYKGFRCYQPLNVWWAEQKLMVFTEFRDGNVPASYEVPRVFRESLAYLPDSVTQVRYRGDTASYQPDFLLGLERGDHSRFGRIEFAVSVPVCAEFRAAVETIPEESWQRIYEYTPEGERIDTRHERAEVDFVGGFATSKKGTIRFLATRELLDEQVLPGIPDEERPFPVLHTGTRRFKLHGQVTNLREEDGWDTEDVIRWLWKRCGKSEEVHSVLKNDLGGGKLPSKYFGANAAWWWMAVFAHNLTSILKQVFLGGEWAEKRMKALRFHLVHLPGRVIAHARKLTIRLTARAQKIQEVLLRARKRMLERGAPG